MKKNLAILFLMTILLTACAGANPLGGTTWELVSYGDVGTPILALPDGAAIISFDTEGTLSGNVGCNQFSGTYSVSGEKLKTGPIMATAMACMDAARMNQESAVLMLLNGNLSFESDGDTLTIFSEDGKSALHLMRAEK